MSSTSPGLPGIADAIKAFTHDEQDPAIIETVCERVQQLLTVGEKIIYIAVQKKPVVNIAPDCAVLTNRRFIVYRPRLLGRVTFDDYLWRDLQDAKLQENILGATLTMRTVQGSLLTVDHLPKAQARRLYAFAQEMEEKCLDERRERDLEDKRAGAGGVVVNGVAGVAERSADPVQRLKALKEMLDAGLISVREYESKKAEIISKV